MKINEAEFKADAQPCHARWNPDDDALQGSPTDECTGKPKPSPAIA